MSANRAYVLRGAEMCCDFEIIADKLLGVVVVVGSGSFKCWCMAASNSRARRTWHLELSPSIVFSWCLVLSQPA